MAQQSTHWSIELWSCGVGIRSLYEFYCKGTNWLLLLNYVNEYKQMHRWQFELKGPWIAIVSQQPKSSHIAIFLVMICVQKSQRLNLKLIFIIIMEAPSITWLHVSIPWWVMCSEELHNWQIFEGQLVLHFWSWRWSSMQANSKQWHNDQLTSKANDKKESSWWYFMYVTHHSK